MDSPAAIKITLPRHILSFYMDQNAMVIVVESTDHTLRWNGKFNNDLIQQLSNDFLESVEDFMDYLLSNQKQDICSMTEEGKLKIIFKYSINKKEKIKQIQFQLTVENIDDLTVIKIQNAELKAKLCRMDQEMQHLKSECDRRIQIVNEECNSKISMVMDQMQILRNQLTQKIQSSNGECNARMDEQAHNLKEDLERKIQNMNAGWNAGVDGQIQYVKNEFERQIQTSNTAIQAKFNAVQQTVQNVQAQYDTTINNSQAKINTLQGQIANIKSQYDSSIKALQTRVESKCKFDQVFVRQIVFSNGWRLGYSSPNYFGFCCKSDGSDGYWLKHRDGYVYLEGK